MKLFSKKQLNRKNHNILFKAVYATLTPLKLFKNSLKSSSKFLKISGENFLKKFYGPSGCQVHQYACRVYIGQIEFNLVFGFLSVWDDDIARPVVLIAC